MFFYFYRENLLFNISLLIDIYFQILPTLCHEFKNTSSKYRKYHNLISNCIYQIICFNDNYFVSGLNLFCPKCNRKYNKLNSLQCHLRRDCGTERKFQCSVCPQSFKRKHTLKDHVSRKHRCEFQNIFLDFME